MYDNHTHSVPDRIVSLNQPFVRPIVRGKTGKPVECGMKLDISISNGWTRLKYHSFDAYSEATKLQEMIEDFHRREGHFATVRKTEGCSVDITLYAEARKLVGYSGD